MTTLALLAYLAVPRLDLRLDLSFFMPDEPPSQTVLLIDRLRDTVSSVIMIGISGAPADRLSEASSAITTSLRDSGEFVSVVNGHTASIDRNDLQPLLAARYLLLPVAHDAFDTTQLRHFLSQRVTDLASSRGWLLRDLLLRDPTGALELIARRWGAQGPEHRHGVWMNAAGTRALIVARTKASSSDLVAQGRVSAAVAAAAGPWQQDGLKIEASGPGLIALETSQVIRSEMAVLSAIGSLLVAMLVLLAFRAPSLLVVIGLPLVSAVIAGAAAVQLLFGHVHGVALTFGAALIGVAVDYPVHLTVHLRDGEAPSTTVRRIARPLLLSAVTTAGGFTAIAVSDFPGLAQLGTLAAVGVVTAHLTSRWVLPWLLPAGLGDRIDARRWLSIAASLSRRRWLRVGILALLAAMIITAVLRPGPLWESDLGNLGAVSSQVRERDRQLRADLHAPNVRFLLVVRGDDVETVLQRQEKLQPALDAAVATNQINSYEMAANLLPSARLQRERQVVLPDRAALAQSLGAALKDLPIKASAMAAFIDDVAAQRARQPLIVDDLPAGPFTWRLEPLLRHERGGVSGLVLLQGPVDAAAMTNLAATAGDEVHFLDMRAQASRLVVGYRDAVLTWLAIGAVVGMGVLLFGMRSLQHALRVAIPPAMAIVWTISILIVLGIPLTLFHLLALLLVAGVGVDYAVFYVGYSRSARDGARNLQSILLCSASTVAVFATLAFSSMPVLSGIGLTVALGVGAALLSTVVFFDSKSAEQE